jgi:hypothetical protein
MADDVELQKRIQERAYQIWLDEGQPEGRDKEHWELAMFAISERDALPTMLKAPELPGPEPIEAVANQAEMPTLTDQGEQQIPVRRKKKA